MTPNNNNTKASTFDISISKDEYIQIIDRLLRHVSFQIFPGEDGTVEEFIFTEFLEQEMNEKKAAILAKQGSLVARQFYPFQSQELRRVTGVYAGYFFSIDDVCLGEGDFQKFRRSLIEGLPQSKFFAGCAKLLRGLDTHYLEFCLDKVTTGLINHMNSTALEYETTGKFLHLLTSPKFAQYFRSMTGNAEAFVYFIVPREIWSGYNETMTQFVQAVPELIDFTNKVNDILSFYKESIVSSERNGYVYHRAQASQSTISECLSSLVDGIFESIHNIEATLISQPDLFKVVNGFIRGYIAFHVIEPRYRIGELAVPCLK